MARPGRPVGGGPVGRARRRPDTTSCSTARTCPTSSRSRRWVIALVAVLLALGIAGSVSGAWATILLWVNRVPFIAGRRPSPTRSSAATSASSCSTCRFLRFAQATGQRAAPRLPRSSPAPATSPRRLRGGEVFVHPGPRPPRRARRAVPAVGRVRLPARQVRARLQHRGRRRDRRRLHGRQRPVPRLRRADPACRASPARCWSRRVHPLAVAARARSSWSGSSPRSSSAGSTRRRSSGSRSTPTSTPRRSAFIANNISMTRLAFGLDGWDARAYSGTAPLTRRRSGDEADTFTQRPAVGLPPARRRRSTSSRPSASTTTSPTSTPTATSIDGTLRQVMLSGRELAIERNEQARRAGSTSGSSTPTGSASRWSRSTRSRPRASRELWVRDLPPVSSSGAPEITQPRIYFGERDEHYVVTGARQPEFDYPGRRRSSATRHTTLDRARPGSRSTSTLPRLLFSLRFRDFDLLISDQITSDSQLLFHRTLSDRLAARSRRSCATTRTRTSSSRTRPARLRPGRVHDQRPLPARDRLQPARARPRVGPVRRRR